MKAYKTLLIFLAAVLAACGGNNSKEAENFRGIAPIEWAKRMADSDQQRVPNPSMLDFVKQPKWNYTHGLVCQSNQELYHFTKDKKYWNYALSYADQMVDSAGNIKGGYALSKFSLDQVNAGKIFFDIYHETQEPRFKLAMDTLYEQLLHHPRNADGGYWHKKHYPWQMWLDGVYMGDPFVAEYGATFRHPELIDDAIKQVELIQQHTYQEETGLNYHGYDEKKEQHWANKETGRSSHVWGRAQGWYCMALVDILDFIPENHPKRAWFISNLQQVYEAVLRAQDTSKGLWWQVMDQPGRAGNYFESTCATMFVYSFAKAYNKGYVEDEYWAAAKRGFQAILSQFIKENGDGTISIEKCCAVAGLGGKDKRDGSFEYYLSEPIRANDPKAVGPFILAAIELQKQLDQQAPASAANCPFPMPEVQIPTFRPDTFCITDFGAVPNSLASCTQAINAAISKCSEQGGGVVLIPQGLWISGPIYLKSRVNLHTEKGTFVQFTSNLNEYKLINSYFEGNSVIRCESPIMGIDLEDIAITGEGIFDGNGQDWRPVKIGKMTAGQWQKLVDSGGQLTPNGKVWYPSKQAYLGNEQKEQLPAQPTPENMTPYKRALRPVMVSLVRCKRLLLDGPSFQNSPAWNVNPLMCEHLTLRNLTIRNPWYSQNGDGLDLESCRIGTVTNCSFDVGDDAICIKSGKNKEGRERGMPTEQFVISDCVVYHGHGGFVVGSEMSGGVRNLWVKNLTFIGTDCGLRFKSVRGRGGVVENIWMENIRMVDIPTEAIRFNLYYAGKSAQEDPLTGEIVVDKMPVNEETPAFRNMHFKHIYVDGAKQALKIMGIPEMPVENISLEQMTIRADDGIQINYATNIRFGQVKLQLEEAKTAVRISSSQQIAFDKFSSSGESQLFAISGETTKAISLQMNERKIADSEISVLESIKEQVRIVE